jgi:hypothetical protein
MIDTHTNYEALSDLLLIMLYCNACDQHCHKYTNLTFVISTHSCCYFMLGGIVSTSIIDD